MRISMRTDDPGHRDWASRCDVKFNGELWRRRDRPAHTADEEKGELHVYCTDQMNAYTTDWETVILHGTVEIVIPDDIRKAFL